MTISELNEFMYCHGFCNTNNEADLPKKYVADLIETALREGYEKAIYGFYDKAVNFEDYIEPVEIQGVQLYSGIDVTRMIVKVREELLNKADN